MFGRAHVAVRSRVVDSLEPAAEYCSCAYSKDRYMRVLGLYRLVADEAFTATGSFWGKSSHIDRVHRWTDTLTTHDEPGAARTTLSANTRAMHQMTGRTCQATSLNKVSPRNTAPLSLAF